MVDPLEKIRPILNHIIQSQFWYNAAKWNGLKFNKINLIACILKRIL